MERMAIGSLIRMLGLSELRLKMLGLNKLLQDINAAVEQKDKAINNKLKNQKYYMEIKREMPFYR